MCLVEHAGWWSMLADTPVLYAMSTTSRLCIVTTMIPPGPTKCDAKIGPQQGLCPMAKCPPPPKGCKMKREFSKTGDACCPKPCNYVDVSGKVCKPKVCLPNMINPTACKCGVVTTTVDGCSVTKCKTGCDQPGWCGARSDVLDEFKAWIY